MENNFDLHYVRSEDPQTLEPREVFTQLAVDLGLIRSGDKLDQSMFDFAAAVVEKCAKVADCYLDCRAETLIGEHIRTIYGKFPGPPYRQ
jgi:hypothetical protein